MINEVPSLFNPGVTSILGWNYSLWEEGILNNWGILGGQRVHAGTLIHSGGKEHDAGTIWFQMRVGKWHNDQISFAHGMTSQWWQMAYLADVYWAVLGGKMWWAPGEQAVLCLVPGRPQDRCCLTPEAYLGLSDSLTAFCLTNRSGNLDQQCSLRLAIQ